MMDADIILATFHAGHLVAVVFQQRDVDVAVRKIDAIRQYRLGLADAHETECLLVELRGLFRIGNGQRDMPKLSHDRPRQCLVKKATKAELIAAGCSMGCQWPHCSTS